MCGTAARHSVHLVGEVEALGLDLLDPAADLHAGVAVQDVDPPVALDRACYQAADRVVVGHVGGRRLGPAAGRADQLGRLLRALGRAVGDHHQGALASHDLGAGAPDSRAAGRRHGNPVLQDHRCPALPSYPPGRVFAPAAAPS
jgi:hypothetical protein